VSSSDGTTFLFVGKNNFMNIWNRPDRIPEIYGTLIAIGLIVYFFAMYALGLIHVIELRLLNLAIMFLGVYYALKQYRRTHAGQLNYFRALTTGVAASAIGTATFVLFLFTYLYLDKNLMESIRENEPLGLNLGPFIATFAVFLEGIFSGFMATYILINFINTDQVNEPIDMEKVKKAQG
jgi:hypothetical protein